MFGHLRRCVARALEKDISDMNIPVIILILHISGTIASF